MRVYIKTTRYEGDDFPEADRFDLYVAGRVNATYPTATYVEVSYGPRNECQVYGVGMDRAEDVEQEIRDALFNWWEDFCFAGYKEV